MRYVNLTLNMHRKDVNNPKAIALCNHFKTHGHNFMKYAKSSITEQLNEKKKRSETSDVSKDNLRLLLKLLEDFWIIKLETRVLEGLNQE